MALNGCVVNDRAVMRTMINKTLRLCGLARNEISQVETAAASNLEELSP